MRCNTTYVMQYVICRLYITYTNELATLQRVYNLEGSSEAL